MLKGIYRYYIDYNDDIWPKTTCIASFGPLVSVFLKLFVVFLKLTTIIQRFSNVPKRRDPVLFYYTQPPTPPPQHHHKQQGMMRARDAPAAVSAAYEKRPKRRISHYLGPW